MYALLFVRYQNPKHWTMFPDFFWAQSNLFRLLWLSYVQPIWQFARWAFVNPWNTCPIFGPMQMWEFIKEDFKKKRKKTKSRPRKKQVLRSSFFLLKFPTSGVVGRTYNVWIWRYVGGSIGLEEEVTHREMHLKIRNVVL